VASPASRPQDVRIDWRTLDFRTLTRIVFSLAALGAFLFVLFTVRSTVVLVFVSAFLAVALGPAVDFFVRRGVRRALAILIVYILMVLAIFGVGLLVVPPVVSQVDSLAKNIPGYLDDLRKNKTVRKYDNKYKITEKLKQQATKLPSKLGDVAGTLKSVTVGVFGAIVKLVTVLTMTFFFLLDGRKLMDFLLRLRGPTYEPRYRKVANDIYRSTAGYVAGNLVISLVAGTMAYLTMLILGVPFAVPLAVLMAFLDLIPMVGATIGGVVIGLVTAFNDFPTDTIIWVIVFIIYQQAENNLLQPLIYRRTVNVHPLIVIVAILIGAALLGVLGALVAIPVAAGIQVFAKDMWENRNLPAPEPTALAPPPAAPG
jgi:predicted PurR-regulated permease PerM